MLNSQIISRNKSFIELGTTAHGMYNGTSAQRPSGDFRYLRWNTDSSLLEVKINSSTWRALGFNGTGGSGALTSINSQTGPAISLATGASGTDFAIDASANTITFNIPTASASNRGLLSTTDWSAFNGKLSASDTVGRFWSLSGNTIGGTKYFGSRDNNHIELIANNTIVGRITASGQFLWGSNNQLGAAYKAQFLAPTLIAATPTGQNELLVDDDGVNGQNGTMVVNPSGSNNNTLLLTSVNGNSISFRAYGSTTEGLAIGGRNSVSTIGYFGMLNSVAITATSGDYWTVKATNSFAPTSGSATHAVFEDQRTINQTGGANGITRGVFIHPTLTAAADYRAIENTIGNNYLNSSSGNTLIGTTTNNGERLQIEGTSRLNGLINYRGVTGPPSTYNILVHGLTDSIVYQVPASVISGITTLNTLTASTQTFATGTSGSDFNISSSSSTHTFNIPSASASNRGLVTTTSQVFAGDKTFNNGAIVTFPSSGSGTSLVVSGNRSLAAAPGISGIGLQLASFTYTNSSGVGTETNGQNFHLIGTPTLTSGNAISYTGDVATILFSGAPIAAGSTTISHPWNIFANDVNSFQTLAMGLNEQSGDATLGNGSVVIYTGAGGNTFTLPSLATHPGKTYFIKNAGGGNLTLTRGGSDNIYDTSSVTSITIAAGGAVIVSAGSSFWYVQKTE